MKNKGLWAIVSVLIVLGLILASCAKAPAPATPAPAAPTAPAVEKPKEVIRWQTQTLVGPQTAVDRFPYISKYATIEGYISNWLKDVTDGRLIIDVAPLGSIMPEADLFNAVSKGTLPITTNYGAFYTKVVPEGNAWIGLPFAWMEPAEVIDFYYNWGGKKIMDEIYDKWNIFGLLYTIGSVQNVGAVGMANDLNWFKGKRVRAVGIWQKFMAKVGASAVTIPYGEMYMALKLGTIDGIFLSVPALETIKLKEVLDSWVVYPNTTSMGVDVQINKDALNALPEDIQRIIKVDLPAAMALFALRDQYNYQHWVAGNAEKQGYIKQIRWDAENTQKAIDIGVALWDDVALASPQAAKLVELIKAQNRDYGRIK